MSKANLPIIREVLQEAGEPLKVNDILMRAGPRLRTRAINPSNTIHKVLSLDIRDNPDSCFKRTAPGTYALK